jgi:hypothetical protein
MVDEWSASFLQAVERVTTMTSETDSNCPIPAAHGRLREAQRFWRQSLSDYYDPEGFRANVNATIQALRNTTLMLQSEHDAIPDFQSWYAKEQERMKADNLLRWLVGARNRVVHRGDLQTYSKARVQLLVGYGDPPLIETQVSPRLTAEAIAARFSQDDSIPAVARSHGVLRVERRWTVAELPDLELLDVLAHCYERLSSLLRDAHKERGLTMHDAGADAMSVSQDARTVLIDLPSGRRIVSESEPLPRYSRDNPPSYDVLTALEKRYGPLPLQRSEASRDILDDGVTWLEHAKRVLASDGHHNTFVFLIPSKRQGGAAHVHIGVWEDPATKVAFWHRLAAEVERTGAEAVMVVAEQWYVPKRDWLPGKSLEEQPDRREALSVSMVVEDGRGRTWTSPFTRSVDGTISFGTTEVTESGHPSLQAIVDQWKRRQSATS